MTSWDQPGMACMPCRGRGWITQEDATGMPGPEVTCPYCHGKGTSWWVAPRRRRRMARYTHRRLVILGLALGLVMVGPQFPALDSNASPYWFVLHLALWLALLVAWVKSPPRRKVDPEWKPRFRRQHAPGWNTAREGKFLAGFGAVVGLRSLWDSHEKRGF